MIAKRIDLSQENEIELMRKWPEARDEEAPQLHRVHGHAVTMVERLRAGDAGAEPEIDAFARHVDSDQRIEIARMQRLLAKLRADGGQRRSSD